MFGVRAESGNREEHFANSAKRFALDAKMFRCRSAVHVENKDDIVFWSGILKHFLPDERFHFIAGSRNEFGRETCGVTQCLKYYNCLSSSFIICIDSDYRYLMHEKGMDAGHFVLQTYTYSFENHHCFADGLDDVCSRVTHLNNRIFDFRRFLREYSEIVYDLFIWHLYFLGSDPVRFTKYDFNQFIGLDAFRALPAMKDNARGALDVLRRKAEKRISYLGRTYPQADLQFIREKYEEIGLTPETTYFFIRGHNLYDMVCCVMKEVCKAILKKEKSNHVTREAISALYRERSSVDMELRQNVRYGAYYAIRLIEEDVRKLFG